MPGVIATRVGYAGGTTPDPTYRSMGDHTESVQIDYDPGAITYEELLDVFWSSHRPTGPAPSPQYASRIFWADESQRIAAEESRRAYVARRGPVHTQVTPLGRFYMAEEYHQHYYEKHGMVGAACGTGR